MTIADALAIQKPSEKAEKPPLLLFWYLNKIVILDGNYIQKLYQNMLQPMLTLLTDIEV